MKSHSCFECQALRVNPYESETTFCYGVVPPSTEHECVAFTDAYPSIKNRNKLDYENLLKLRKEDEDRRANALLNPIPATIEPTNVEVPNNADDIEDNPLADNAN